MGENSKIAWTDHTFNPWYGCTKISPACDHCYAEGWAKRSGLVTWGSTRRKSSAVNWRKPVKWNAECGYGFPIERPKVFCASLGDVWDNEVPNEWRADLFTLIRETPNLDWLLLSKRIGNAPGMLPADWGHGYMNVWIGSTIANQEELVRDVPKLLKVPARVRFLSCEPMLSPIDLNALQAVRGLHWIICGGESGSHARSLPIEWARDLRYQAENREIAFFMKQGSQRDWPAFDVFESFPSSVRVRQFPLSAWNLD